MSETTTERTESVSGDIWIMPRWSQWHPMRKTPQGTLEFLTVPDDHHDGSKESAIRIAGKHVKNASVVDVHTTLDQFTRAYIETMLWSSTIAPFGECSSCGEDKVLCQFAIDDPDVVDGVEWTLCADCGGDPSRNSYEPPADDNYGIDDFAPETLARIAKDCTEFLEQNRETITSTDCRLNCRLNSSGCDKWEQAGYDFWLTRTGHGCGFWDGDWEEPAGSKLTEASNGFGELNLYVGDDGKLYF